MKRYGILGGTFDPPHIAHSIIAEDVRDQLNLDKVIFIPSGNPPLKNSISAEHRLAMAKLAFGDNEIFEVSEIEIKNSEEKSYTVNTLTELTEIHKSEPAEFYFIIGLDNLINLPKWKEPDRLFELANIIVINRPEFDLKNVKEDYLKKVKFINVPDMEISSSMLRERISAGKSVKYMVTDEVEEYIRSNQLYKS
jgi:nicotinate-nucleotide adenylyltransferase